MMNSLKRFARASKGLEALQVVLLIAIACVLLAGVQGKGNAAKDKMGGNMDAVTNGASIGG